MHDDLHKALEELKQHLTEIESATSSINKAGKITHAVVSSVDEIQKSYKSQIESITNIIELGEQQRIEGSKTLLTEHLELQKSMISDHIKIENDYFKEFLSSMSTQINKQKGVFAEFSATKDELVSQLSELINFIRSVDFPSRLDKIDNTVSSINLGMQNIQSALQIIQVENANHKQVIEKFQSVQNEKFVHLNKKIDFQFKILMAALILVIASMLFFYFST